MAMLTGYEESVFDARHPAHAGHKKWSLPVRSLNCQAHCGQCGVTLSVPMVAMMVGAPVLTKKGATPSEILAAALGVPAPPEKDPHFPHECPRCHGPAYVGGNNNVDCKRGCS